LIDFRELSACHRLHVPGRHARVAAGQPVCRPISFVTRSHGFSSPSRSTCYSNRNWAQRTCIPAWNRDLFQVLFGLLLGFLRRPFFGPGTGTFWAMAYMLGLGYNMTKATALYQGDELHEQCRLAHRLRTGRASITRRRSLHGSGPIAPAHGLGVQGGDSAGNKVYPPRSLSWLCSPSPAGCLWKNFANPLILTGG